ncbi:FAD-dependent oxidoreductase [Candidatus Woesearchaeota archaeon]|nr:FAD-dependent oxidoreductase [Candidatus Woesearchaeota archaeon]
MEFYTKDGKVLKDISGLIKELKSMSYNSFNHHVNQEKNDFANWIRDIIKEEKLANSISKSHSKKEILEILEIFQKRGCHVHETIIIGAGIAGITAAIYAARKRMDFLLISSDFGGQLNVMGDIENYPGFKHTDMLQMDKNLKEQLEYNNIKIQYENVEKIDKDKSFFKIKTNKSVHESKTLIIATGARARKLGIKGEDEFARKGLTYCAVCDGPLFSNQDVAIIGGGNAALEAADFMMRIAKKIYILNIKKELIANQVLMERITKRKVMVINNAETVEIYGEGMLTGLKYKHNNEIKDLKVQGIVVEIGRIPNSEVLKGFLKTDDSGHIKVDKHCKASKAGAFAAGDCTDLQEYQFVIAAGHGATALLEAAKYLQRR